MIRLYEFALSGNCHKVRLMLSLLGLPYESVLVSGANREHKSAAFLAMNPLGQVPVLTDGDLVVRDSQAILVYLASRYGGPTWWPQDPARWRPSPPGCPQLPMKSRAGPMRCVCITSSDARSRWKRPSAYEWHDDSGNWFRAYPTRTGNSMLMA